MKFHISPRVLRFQSNAVSNRPNSQALAVATGLFAVLASLAAYLGQPLSPQKTTLILLSAGVFSAAMYWAARRHIHLRRQQTILLERLAEAEKLAGVAFQRLSAVFKLSQKIVETTDEKDVIEMVLQMSVDLVGASGATFVPLDERGQPLAAIKHGEIPIQLRNSWMEYLASPAIRDRCGACQSDGELTHTCPLIQTSSREAALPGDDYNIYCLPIRRGEIELGVLNLYFPSGFEPDADTQVFLRTMIDETSMALEGVRLRTRELTALGQLQTLRQRTDLASLLNRFLENVREVIRADFGLLVVREGSSTGLDLQLTGGDFPAPARSFLLGLLTGVINSGQPVLMTEVLDNPGAGEGQNVRSLMASPLVATDGQVSGAILLGNLDGQHFTKRQLLLLQTMAGQVAVVVKNSLLMADLEFKAVIAERTRLAREIHDGLAQTLGFLKLQTAQMQNYLTRGEVDRLQETLGASYKALAEAYLDARQAIDGLRISPTSDGLARWLEQTAAEFEDTSGLCVTVTGVHCSDHFPPEIQLQLIRIVQEALSNIRKHAQASEVWIKCLEEDGELLLEVGDNGRGFSPEDVPQPSRHGLQGMRERIELIGADFQVTSQPGLGTRVIIRMAKPVGAAL